MSSEQTSGPAAVLFCGISRCGNVSSHEWVAHACLSDGLLPAEFFTLVEKLIDEENNGPEGKQHEGCLKSPCGEYDVWVQKSRPFIYAVVTQADEGGSTANLLLCSLAGEIRIMDQEDILSLGQEGFKHISSSLEEVFTKGGPMDRPLEIALQVNDSTFAGLIRGPLDGTKVLCFHGWMDNAATHAPLSALMATRGFLVVALDFAGHGHSTHRNFQFYDTPSLVCDSYDCVVALGWDKTKFHIVGHSMGASVAVCFSAVFRDMVSKVVLLDGIGPLSIEKDRTVQTIKNAAMVRGELRSKSLREYPNVRAAALRLRETASMNIESAITIASRGTEVSKEDGMVRFMHDLCLRAPSPRPFVESQVYEIIRRIACPVMIMRPDNGIPFPKEVVAGRMKKFRRLKYFKCSGGHHFHIDDPQSIIQPLANFLLGIPSGKL